MRIAVPYENGNIFQHFGRSEAFKFYDVDGGAVTAAAVVSTNGSGHGALAGFLMQRGVDTLICGGIGGGAQMALAEAGIKLYGGVSNEADEQLLHPLQRLVEQETIPCSSDKKTRIVKAQLGNQAGIIGAALLGKKKRI